MDYIEKPYRLEIIEAAIPVEQFIQTCVDVPKIWGHCKECRNYGATWACPPFDFEPMQIWKNYRSLHLRSHVLYPNKGAERNAVLNGMGQERKKLISYLME